MAIPDFSAQMGYALMRQNTSTSEWFFVDWCNGEVDEIVDFPGAGTWRYEVWGVIGHSSGFLSVGYGGSSGGVNLAQIVVQQLKR